jgi:hypothetical protein
MMLPGSAPRGLATRPRVGVLALRGAEQAAERFQRIDALSTIVVVGVYQRKRSFAIERVQTRDPLAQFVVAVSVVIALPGVLVLPPLGRVSA